MSGNQDQPSAERQGKTRDVVGRALLSVATHVDQELEHEPLAGIASSANARAMWRRHRREVARVDLHREPSRVDRVVLWTRRAQWVMVVVVVMALILRLSLAGSDALDAAPTGMAESGWFVLTPLSTLLLATTAAVGLLLTRVQQHWREI